MMIGKEWKKRESVIPRESKQHILLAISQMKLLIQVCFSICILFWTYPLRAQNKEVSKWMKAGTISMVDQLNKRAKNIIIIAPDSTLLVAKKARRIAKELDYQVGEARAISWMGLGKYNLQEYDSALLFFHESLNFREMNKLNPNGVAATHSRLGTTYEAIGMYARSLAHRNIAREIRDLFGSPDSKADAYNDLGISYKLITERKKRIHADSIFAEIDSAILYFQKSLKIHQEDNNIPWSIRNCNALSSLFLMKEIPDSALHFLDEAEDLLDTQNGKEESMEQDRIDTYLRKGRLFDHMAQYEQAHQYHQKALLLSENLKDTLSMFMILNNLGETKRHQKLYRHAIDYYSKSSLLTESVKKERILRKTLMMNLSAVHDSMGSFSEALRFHRIGEQLGTQIFLEEQQLRILDAEDNIKLESQLIQSNLKQKNQRLIFQITVLSGIIFILFLGILIWMQVKRQKLQKNRLRRKELEHKTELLSVLKSTEKEMLVKQNEIQDKVLQKIGRELHDGVGAVLLAAKMEMENLKNLLTQYSPEASNSFDYASSLIKKAFVDMRKISHDLNHLSLNGGLIPALEELSEKINSMENTPFIHLNITNPGTIPLSPKIELHIYRIIQESMSNIIKHARAQEVELQLLLADSILSIAIEDDGIGFDPLEQKNGFGLQSIKSRVEELKGTFTLDSRKENGTSLFVEIPVSIQVKS